jgi:hypothetical protein
MYAACMHIYILYTYVDAQMYHISADVHVCIRSTCVKKQVF